MCINKLSPKQLEEICMEAIKIDSGISVAEIKSYEKNKKEKHYEVIDYDGT